MSDKQALARVGEVIASKYRLERLLGAGGMGAVYAATHEFTKRNVAVKLMHEGFAKSPVFAERFVREAQAPSAIGHPGIVEVLDGGFDDKGALYLVLEMLQGKTLGDLETPLSVPDLVDVTTQLLDALGAAHKAGFVHRDIKPDNVFLTHDGTGKRKVKLLDFGVAGLRASADNANLTQTGTILGTPTFMSPEQAKGERVDQRSDLWAVGAILYDALAGHPPHDADTYNAVIVSIVTREHVPLERLRPDLPRALLEVIERGLRKDTSQRWQSAEQMAKALRAIDNLEALSGVVTKQQLPDAVAKTAVARRGNAPAHSIDAPHLTRPDIAQANATRANTARAASLPITKEDVATPAPPQPSAKPRPARNITTVAAAESGSPRVGVWVLSAATVIALAIGAAWFATSNRAPNVEAPLAVATTTSATAASDTRGVTAGPVAPSDDEPAAIAQSPQPTQPSEATPPQPVVPLTPTADLKPLSSTDLSAAISAVQAKLQRCYQDDLAASLVKGSAMPTALSLSVTLHVVGSGTLQDVTIDGGASDTLIGCMRGHLRSLTFRSTTQAAELNFPVVFQPAVIAP